MSWGTDLWDQSENLATHTQKGIDFVEKFGHFLKEKCAIEQEYAAKLKRLVKSHQPKKKEEDDYQFTIAKSFLSMIKEVHDIASQHEIKAELINAIDVGSLVNELKQERKRCLKEGVDLQKQLNSSLQQAETARKQYDKSYREAEKAQDNYKRADADINLSRAEVEKQKTISQQKARQFNEYKTDYGAQLGATNRQQEEHYSKLMPRVFQSLQEMDEMRIKRLQGFIETFARSERDVIPIINTCIDGIQQAAITVDVKKDSWLVIERYRSGFQPPTDIPFDHLGDVNDDSDKSGGSQTNITPKATIRTENKGTASGKKKKRGVLGGIFGNNKNEDVREDFSHLNPAQQMKQLNQKINEIKSAISKETMERDGMMKLQKAYEQNPALGDANSLDKKLEENGQKLDQLKLELTKFEGYLAIAEGAPNTPKMDNGTSRRISRDTNRRKDSASDDSNISRSPSNLSVQSGSHQTTNNQAEMTNNQTHKTYPDGGLGSNLNVPHAGDDSFDESDLPDPTQLPLPPIGTCKAVYPFQAQNEGSISMKQDEILNVIERDVSDGWTLVRRMDQIDEGYVPTTYIEITWF